MRLRLAPVLLAIAAIPALAAAQMPGGCPFGQRVVDDRGHAGLIVGGRDTLCLVKYQDGVMQRWVDADQLRITAPSGRTAPGEASPNPAAAEPESAQGVTILRPTIVNRLVYRADALGHVVLTAMVNDAPVRFLVDTGATLVSLSPQDAVAAGLDRAALKFDQTVHTGNGPVAAAFTQLRTIRIDGLEIADVQAAIIDNLNQSVLGMSFLRRLKGFEMRDGALTIDW
jgi:aspartyl protease family protein